MKTYARALQPFQARRTQALVSGLVQELLPLRAGERARQQVDVVQPDQAVATVVGRTVYIIGALLMHGAVHAREKQSVDGACGHGIGAKVR